MCVYTCACTHVLSNLGHETRKENMRVEEIVRERGVRKTKEKIGQYNTCDMDAKGRQW